MPQVRLSNVDLHKVLGSIATLNSAVDLATLRQRTLGCVMSLIPNSTMTAFDGLDPEGDYDGSLWYSPPGTVSQERVDLLADLLYEHPYCQEFFSTQDESIFRITDKLPRAQFHKTTLFNEFYRLFDGEAQIASVFRLSSSSLVACSFHRPKTDFTDVEVEMLRLITPHLKAAFKNAKYVEQTDRFRDHLDGIVTKGLIVCDESGKVISESRLAREWLQKYFPKSYSGELPRALFQYIQRAAAATNGKEYYRPIKSLSISVGDDQLNVSVTFDNRLRETLILFEERRPHLIEDFMGTGVTTREAEILYFISRGKTDSEIALLLSISPRTVQKHLEHVFTKFGVETRTAAVMHMLSLR